MKARAVVTPLLTLTCAQVNGTLVLGLNGTLRIVCICQRLLAKNLPACKGVMLFPAAGEISDNLAHVCAL